MFNPPFLYSRGICDISCQPAQRCRGSCITVTRTLIKRREWVRGGESSGVCYEGLFSSAPSQTLPIGRAACHSQQAAENNVGKFLCYQNKKPDLIWSCIKLEKPVGDIWDFKQVFKVSGCFAPKPPFRGANALLRVVNLDPLGSAGEHQPSPLCGIMGF